MYVKSCVKLNTLEPFEDQDLAANELDESEKEETVTVVLEEAREKWDCESICSKYVIVQSRSCQQDHSDYSDGGKVDVLQ